MATLWSVFTPRVLLDVPRCPSITAEDAVRDAAIDFCKRTRVLRIDHTPIDAVATQATYSWAPGADLKVIRAEEVWFEKKKLDPILPGDLSVMYDYWPDETGVPAYYLQESEETLLLVPKPESDLSLAIRAKVSVRPTVASTDIDDAIYDKYVEEIVWGAKARLFIMRQEAWYDAALAQHFRERFEVACAGHNINVEKGRTRSSLRVRAVHGIE